MPSGLEGLEIKARSLAQEMLARGNCTLNLTLRREAGELAIRLNEAALSQALAAAKRAQGLTQLAAPGLDALLGMRGVVEVVEGEESEEAHAKLEDALLKGLGTALDQLVAARKAEGARLATVMANQLSQIASLVERAANASARQPVAIMQRLERADRADHGDRVPASIPSGCIRKRCCSPPRPISRKSSTAFGPM